MELLKAPRTQGCHVEHTSFAVNTCSGGSGMLVVEVFDALQNIVERAKNQLATQNHVCKSDLSDVD